MKTLTELEQLKPCPDGLAWARQQPSLYDAWENCERSDWMWWLLRKLNKIPKALSVQYAQGCASHVKQLNNWYAAAYTDDIAAAYASYAAYIAAAYATDSIAERKWQANFLRTLTPNPFL